MDRVQPFHTMKSSRLLTWMVVIGAVLTCITGCGQDAAPAVNNADLPGFNDIVAAPAKIQTAARAVVRLRTARQSATGSFVSATGLLLTNNHVLGDTVCPVEGCYVEVTFMRQRGEARQQPLTLFAKPVAVDVGMDMAVVQLYYYPGGNKIDTPDYLSFDSQDSPSLIGKHVTIVGHPEAYLKKWTDGVVTDATGKWFKSTAYVLPGDSGSPVLDDAGRIVGLIHRGPASEDLFTSNGANMYSIGTASAPIMAAMSAPLPGTVISVAAATTNDDFLANDLVYLNAHAASINVNGTSVGALSLLGTACDSALARNDFKSPNDLQSALTPCYHAQTWIDCRVDAPSSPYGVVCPSGSESINWANRFRGINQLWLNMNGVIDYNSVSFAIAHLQPTMAAGVTAGAQELQKAIAGPNPVLDYLLSSYLVPFNIDTFNGMNIKDYIVNYRNSLHYELDGHNIVYAADWLYANGGLVKTGLLSLLSGLYNDPNVSLGTKLFIEDLQYQLDSL